MTRDKIEGVVRAVAAPILTYLAAKGYLVDSQTGELLIVAISAAVTAGWSIYAKRTS